MTLGAVLVAVGVFGLLRSDSVTVAAADVDTTNLTSEPGPATDTSAAETTITTTSPPTTTTSTTVPVTTTTSSTTTTTLPPETVEEFVLLFAAAIMEGDTDFLFDRLHPAVVGGFGADLCQTWIAREILTLENYHLTGPATGPQDQPFTSPVGEGIIGNSFSAPVVFTFSGQEFESDGGFALIGDQMHWLGQCR